MPRLLTASAKRWMRVSQFGDASGKVTPAPMKAIALCERNKSINEWGRNVPGFARKYREKTGNLGPLFRDFCGGDAQSSDANFTAKLNLLEFGGQTPINPCCERTGTRIWL